MGGKNKRKLTRFEMEVMGIAFGDRLDDPQISSIEAGGRFKVDSLESNLTQSAIPVLGIGRHPTRYVSATAQASSTVR